MKLDRFVDILSGFAFQSKFFNLEGRGLPILRIRDVTSNSVSSYYEGEYKDAYLIENGDLLIGMDGQFNLIEWKGGKALLNQRVCKVTPKEGKIDKNFIKHLLPKSLKEIEDKTAFVTVKHLSVKGIKEIILPETQLETQVYIARILDNAASLRDKTAQLLKEYDLLAQSIFLDMFGDPTKGNVKILDKSITVLGGYAFKSIDFVDEGIPVIKIGTVNKGYFDLKSFSYLPENALAKYKKWIIKPKDLLISLTGTVGKDDYGNIEIATNEFSNYLLNQRVAKIEVNDNYNPTFLYYMFLQIQVKQLLTKVSRGVRQANISNSDISKLKLIKPNISFQNQFAEKIALIEQQKELAKQELKESEDLFNCLLQKAFRGELVQKEEVINA